MQLRLYLVLALLEWKKQKKKTRALMLNLKKPLMRSVSLKQMLKEVRMEAAELKKGMHVCIIRSFALRSLGVLLKTVTES